MRLHSGDVRLMHLRGPTDNYIVPALRARRNFPPVCVLWGTNRRGVLFTLRHLFVGGDPFGERGALGDVPLDKEVKEESKVRDVHEAGKYAVGSDEVAADFEGPAKVLNGEDVGEWVLVGVVHAGCGQDGADNHLYDLEDRDDHSPPWSPSTRGEVVIKVHDGVDKIVDCAKEDPNGLAANVGVPRVQQDGQVMEPVQEGERLLPGYNEEGVDQLDVFRVYKQCKPQPGRTLGQRDDGRGANRRHEAVPDKVDKDVWHQTKSPNE